jgi:hypothetical protein
LNGVVLVDPIENNGVWVITPIPSKLLDARDTARIENTLNSTGFVVLAAD